MEPEPIKTTPAPEPGLYYDVPFDVYSAWDAFRQSDTGPLLRSPLHWADAQVNRPGSDAFLLGSMIDMLVFDGREAYDNTYVERPATYEKEESRGRGMAKVSTIVQKPFNLNSNTCKQIMLDLEASGKTVVGADMANTATRCAEAIRAHPLFAKWLEMGRSQVSMVWVDSATGVVCKGRIDLLAMDEDPEDAAIVDLKSTRNACRNDFRRSIGQFRYHVQAGLYQDGFASLYGGLYLPFYFAAVETDSPFATNVIPLGPDSLASGLLDARDAMRTWAEIRRTGLTPGYPVYQDEIEILPYLIRQDIDETGFGG